MSTEDGIQPPEGEATEPSDPSLPADAAGPSDLVVIGSSAGGVEALSVLVATLPAGFPAPIILAQHLDRSRPSSLGTILEWRSTLPVVVVSGRTALEKGKIYVIPSNRMVRVMDGHLELSEDDHERPHPSIDRLLASAAPLYGERLIAVILTGSGSDGAVGAVEVKREGGTVIIQNPSTARYPSMPMALPPTLVDYVSELDHIGPLLHELVTGGILPEARERTDDPLHKIFAHISRLANIDFSPYKPSTILRRISRRMAATHTRALDDYSQYLEAHPEEVSQLVMAFLIKVTEFFRDADAFDHLRDQVLPALIRHGRERGRVLRFWSAGCATGEEPYSLAILVAELLGTELGQWSVKIFATDLDEGAINFARRGLYPANMLGSLPEAYRDRYFEPVDSGYRIIKSLRQMVIFGQQDLSRGVPFPRIDLIMCRNLLIYFKPELQQEVLDLFAYSLGQQGYLFLGKAETARPSKAAFELVNKKWKIYRCTQSPGTLAPRQGRFAVGGPGDGHRRGRALGADADHRGTPDKPAGPAEIDPGQLRRFNELVFRTLPIGVVVIDNAYRILTISATARRLLGIRDAGGHDFLHAAQGLAYAQVRSSIDAALRERGPVTLGEQAIDTMAGGEGRYISLNIAPVQSETSGPDLIVISVTDVTETVQTRRRLEAMQAEQVQLVGELSAANKRLGDMNKDLQDADEELQAANEELMLAQEELQATDEEFEATDEELQATNEELETNDEELQAADEELEATDEELQARTAELQEMARSLASERVRLSEMVELAPFYILVLSGPGLKVEAFNPRYTRFMEGLEAIGRPLGEVFRAPDAEEFVRMARETFAAGTVRTTARMHAQLPDDKGQVVDTTLVYTMVPTHDSSGKVDGLVIYSEDVSAQVVVDAVERRELLKLIIEHAEQSALGLYDARTEELLQANPRYLDLIQQVHGFARDTIIGRKWHELAIVRPCGESANAFEEVRRTGAALRLPEVHVPLAADRGAGETIWDYTLVPVPAPSGEKRQHSRFLMVSAIEISEQVRVRQELEQIDHLKDEFLALASHELRTPLMPLMGYLDALGRDLARRLPAGEPGPRDLIDKARRQIEHMGRLIDDLLDVARLQTGKFSLARAQVNLVRVLERAVEQARLIGGDTPAIRLEFAEADRPLAVTGDEGRLTQVVLNLLQNALRYAPRSERIDVRLSRVRGLITPAGAPPPEAQIEVEDHGPGIEPEALQSIFTRFYQAVPGERPALGGLGLGLFISKSIIEQHGGSISVSSIVGKGSTFTIRLPLLLLDRASPEPGN